MDQDGIGDDLERRLEEWLRWDRNEATRKEVEEMRRDAPEQLGKVMVERINFGTAGLRGRMAAGFACMNDLVIVQTAQGLLEYLVENHPVQLEQNGLVIGYDGRYNSRRFAELTAAVFLHANYPVRLFSEFVITPFVPFAVSKWCCAAGVMVTASHNPKEDNGYKVYAQNGCQICPPADKDIQKAILANLEPKDSSWDTAILANNPLLADPLEDITAAYLKVLKLSVYPENMENNLASDLKIAYTAMHGVGYKTVVKAMSVAGLEVVPVVEQVDPDPEFPTVKFPNPEEGKGTLDLAIKTAEENGCTLILANDPDADRLAVAEKDVDTGEWRIFNGNELGALLGYWMYYNFQLHHPNTSLSDVYMLASTVSSKILRTIAKREGFHFIETLTGFKWMGDMAHKLIANGKDVIFAYEEAIGFMCGSSVLDKDGVSAAVQMASFAVHLRKQSLTAAQQLEDIYRTYGLHVSKNSYFICHDKVTIKRIFKRLRNFVEPNTYPTSILKGKYKVKSVRDLTTGYDNSKPNNQAVLPVSKSSQMITFEFDNGLVATLRTSGTEPKIKYYTELCASPDQTDKDEVLKLLDEMVDALVDEFLQPTKNGLKPKED